MKKLSEKRKLRQVRLQRRRTKNALKRKAKRKALRRLKSSKRKTAGSKKSRFTRRGVTNLTVPAVLNLGDQFNVSVTFLKELRKTAFNGTKQTIFIDLSGLESICPEMALMLAAEIDRCLGRSGKTIRGNVPRMSAPLALLCEVGYFAHFNMKVRSVAMNERITMQVKSESKTSGKWIDSLLEIFRNSGNLQPHIEKALYKSLIECMDNVQKHAYLVKELYKLLWGRWWMMGIADVQRNEILFYFFDQGSGIPTTLRSKFPRLSKLVIPDYSYVVDAVKNGNSRLKDKRRGNGLPSLLNFLKFAPGGELRIFSNRAITKFSRNSGLEEFKDSTVSLDGTLICWRLSASGLTDIGPLNIR